MKQRFATLLSMAVLAVALLMPAGIVSAQSSRAVPATFADAKSDICEGVGLTGSNCNASGANSSVSSTIQKIIMILSVIVGVVAVVMIIIGGLKYITSAGDASGIASAKNTVIYAIVGLIIVALAQVIVRFVIGNTA